MLALSLLALVAPSLLAPPARAETVNCTAITSLPAVITVQGVYCLTGDLSTAMTPGNAIEIQTNNVVLELNGHKLGGLAVGSGTTAYGIFASQRRNITIRNGTVRGFNVGIFLHDFFPYTSSQGHLVEGIHADLNTAFGILMLGQGNLVRNNQVVGTGGSTTAANVVATGISVSGPDARVLNNDIVDTHATGNASSLAVLVSSAPGTVVEGNRIGNPTLPSGGRSYGVLVSGSADVLVVDNALTTLTFGINFGGGGSSGKYRDNLTSGVTTPFTAGTDAGNNN
jgi:hypothetical protein